MSTKITQRWSGRRQVLRIRDLGSADVAGALSEPLVDDAGNPVGTRDIPYYIELVTFTDADGRKWELENGNRLRAG